MKTEITNILDKPFDNTLIKSRKNKDGETLSYVEGSQYIRRLNQAFGYNWSFEITDMKVVKDEVIVLGKLTADGITKMQYGTSGDSSNENRILGDRVKAAGTDALRKCASLFGLGLHLYEGSQHIGGSGNNGHPENNNQNNGHEDTETRLTSRQLKAIHAIRTRLEITDAGLKELCQKRYGKTPDYLSKKQASALIDEMSKRAEGGNSYEQQYSH
jgi:hypothetical protein